MFFQTLNLESDDDVNNFMKGFGHALKLWELLSALHFIL